MGRIVMAEGRMAILENIEAAGSINQAAKNMKMSYKGVWSKIKSTEKHLNMKIVIADRQAGTRLTAEGKALLENYKRLKAECRKRDDQVFSRIFRQNKK
jgi:molybdate transport system regulatory protein